VIGIGVDLVELDRFRVSLARTPGIITRCFTGDEQAYARAKRDPTERYAVRFAAKEAVMKAMGVGLGEVRMVDIEVVRNASGRPSIVLHGSAAKLAEAHGIVEWKITLTHTKHMAEAIAVALGPGSGSGPVSGPGSA
jgi:holo-[acyl-carrier protein] synthase